jgi:integrase
MAMLALLRGGGVREPCRKHATRKALREVFKWGCDPTVTYAMRDPTFGVPYIRVETEGFHTWTGEDVLQYLNYHRPFSRAGRALGILLFTGAARCDVVNFGRQHVSNGRLKYRRDKTSVPIDVLPELQASIAATPVGNLTFIVTEFGRPFTPLGFGNRVRAWCDEAGLPHCSSHGVRKAGATIAANESRGESGSVGTHSSRPPAHRRRHRGVRIAALSRTTGCRP